MAKVLVLVAGISGHVAEAHLRRKLSKKHKVEVVSPNSNCQWIPLNIWLGIGRIKSKKIYSHCHLFIKEKTLTFYKPKQWLLT